MLNDRRLKAVTEALSWVGAPYRHQGRSKRRGADCGAMISAVGKVLHIPHEDPRGYSRTPNPLEMRRVLDSYLDPIPPSAAQPGDVLVMDFGLGIQHLGILLRGNYLVHANNRVGRIVCHRLGGRWQRRIKRAYKFPGIDD